MMKTNGYIYIDSYILSEYCDKASFVLSIYVYKYTFINYTNRNIIYLFINDPFLPFHFTFSWHFVDVPCGGNFGIHDFIMVP